VSGRDARWPLTISTSDLRRADTVRVDPTQRLTFIVARVAAEISARGAAAISGLRLDGRQLLVLMALGSQEPVSQRELGERLGIDRTTMVQTIDRLEAAGRVGRSRSPQDRRAYDVRMTAAGRRALARANEALKRCEEEFVAGLSQRERETLRLLLLRLPHKPVVVSGEHGPPDA